MDHIDRNFLIFIIAVILMALVSMTNDLDDAVAELNEQMIIIDGILEEMNDEAEM